MTTKNIQTISEVADDIVRTHDSPNFIDRPGYLAAVESYASSVVRYLLLLQEVTSYEFSEAQRDALQNLKIPAFSIANPGTATTMQAFDLKVESAVFQTWRTKPKLPKLTIEDARESTQYFYTIVGLRQAEENAIITQRMSNAIDAVGNSCIIGNSCIKRNRTHIDSKKTILIFLSVHFSRTRDKDCVSLFEQVAALKRSSYQDCKKLELLAQKCETQDITIGDLQEEIDSPVDLTQLQKAYNYCFCWFTPNSATHFSQALAPMDEAS